MRGGEGGLDEETLLVAREFGEDEGAKKPFPLSFPYRQRAPREGQ